MDLGWVRAVTPRPQDHVQNRLVRGYVRGCPPGFEPFRHNAHVISYCTAALITWWRQDGDAPRTGM